LALWKIINEEDVVLILKNQGYKFSSKYFTRNVWGQGGISRYATTPLIATLSPGHSGITKFRPSSPIATGNHLGGAKKKIPKFAQATDTVEVFDPRSDISGPISRTVSACQNLH
jgi:hypothetical protein